MATRIQVRRATAAEWTSANPVLAVGELGLETDTRRIKAGDGTTAWNSLSVLLNGAYAPLADGRLRVTRAAAQSITSATPTDISWDQEDEDSAGYITVPGTTATVPSGKAGIYVVTVNLFWSAGVGTG